MNTKLRFLLYLDALLMYQYGIKLRSLNISEDKLKIEFSKSTGRMRYIYHDRDLIFTLRANDGFLVPTIKGAKLLLSILEPPKLRVYVQEDVADYIAKGRTLFCKHVIDADLNIRPGSEVLVVDKYENLVAVGRAILSGREMIYCKVGKCVKIRKGVNE